MTTIGPNLLIQSQIQCKDDRLKKTKQMFQHPEDLKILEFEMKNQPY